MWELQRIDYDAYYRYLAYQRWLEEKKRKERRKKIAGVIVVLIVIGVVGFFTFNTNNQTLQSVNQVPQQISVPSSVKVIYNGSFVASFIVNYNAKPPLLIVSNYPYCVVDEESTSATVKCTFSNLENAPDYLILYDGEKYYNIRLDKFATVNFKQLPNGEYFEYQKTVYYNDTVTLKFSIVSDRALAHPKVVLEGQFSSYKYSSSENPTPGGFYEYDFSVTVTGLRSNYLIIEVRADNIKEPLTKKVVFNVVKRILTVNKDFSEPVVVIAGKQTSISFTIGSNYDTTLSVIVQKNPYVVATYVSQVPLLAGGQNVVTISLTPGNVTNVEKTTLSILISDKYNTYSFQVPVIVIPQLHLSVENVNASITEDGSISMSVTLRSNLDLDAIIKYTSSPETHSDDFPINIRLKKGLNTIKFKLNGYPPGTKTISVTLFIDLYAYGVEITKVEVTINVNIAGGNT